MPVRKPIKIADLFRFKAPGRVAISPDGRRVVFELKRFDHEKNRNFVNLMVLDVPGGGEAADFADWAGSADHVRHGGRTLQGRHAADGQAGGGAGAVAYGAATLRGRGHGDPALRGAGAYSRVRGLTRGDRVDVMPKFSPDGTRLAFISDRDKGRCLFVLEMDGGEPRRLTGNDGYASDFAWSPDGRSIAYAWQPMSEREKLERDEKHDEIKRMAQFKHIKRLRHKLDGAGWWNGLYTHIHILRVDDESGAGGTNLAASLPKSKQLTFGEFDDSEPRFSPDGRLVSFISNRVEDPDRNLENTDIYVVSPGRGPKSRGDGAKKLTRGPGLCQGHAWSPDGKWIAYTGHAAQAGEDWKYNVRVWLLPAGGGESRELTREIDNHCGNYTLGDVAFSSFEATPPMWSSDSKRLWFVVSEQGACRLYSRSIERRDTRVEVGGDVNIYYADQSTPGGPIAMSVGTATNPGDVYVYDPDRGLFDAVRDKNGAANAGPEARDAEPQPTNAARLTSVNRGVLDTLIVTRPEPFAVKSGTGANPVTVHGWVIKPPNFDPRKKYPAILQIHGGPHAQYGHGMFHEMQAMAAGGYVVCFANPRGSAGYGLKFMNCIHADWGNVDYADLMKVADWLISRPYVDRKRVGVTGGSYGGYMTNWIVGHTNRFAAAVSQRGVVNFESSFGCSDFGWWWAAELGGTPWGARERYHKMAPLTYARNIRTPLLIEHEEQDHRCTIEQAEQLFTTLKFLGREVEMVRFEGESHGLSRTGRPKNREARLKFIMEWMDRYLKPGR